MSPAARSARSARVRFLRGAAGRRSEVATTRIPTARATLGTHIGYSHTLGTDMGTLGTLGTHTLPDQQSTAMYRFLCCSRRTARLTPSRGSPPLPTLAATHAHAPPPSADRRPRGRREAQARDASALACRREASRPLPLCIGTRLWRCGSQRAPLRTRHGSTIACLRRPCDCVGAGASRIRSTICFPSPRCRQDGSDGCRCARPPMRIASPTSCMRTRTNRVGRPSTVSCGPGRCLMARARLYAACQPCGCSGAQRHNKACFVCDEDATLELKVKTVHYFKGLMVCGPGTAQLPSPMHAFRPPARVALRHSGHPIGQRSTRLLQETAKLESASCTQSTQGVEHEAQAAPAGEKPKRLRTSS